MHNGAQGSLQYALWCSLIPGLHFLRLEALISALRCSTCLRKSNLVKGVKLIWSGWRKSLHDNDDAQEMISVDEAYDEGDENSEILQFEGLCINKYYP